MSYQTFADHPYMHAIRTLRYERDVIETQMTAAWRAHRAERHSDAPTGWVLVTYAERLNRLARKRRQLRNAMRLLRAAP